MEPDRIYRHFCMMARSLEVVGERWSLPIVRDLQLGPRRFTDLTRSLGEITPTRLTARLRRLEAAGIVEREPPERGREVWYRLTEAGRDLGPVIDALILWGIRHAREASLPGETVHPDALMIGTKVWLTQFAPPQAEGLTWMWQFPGEDHYTLRYMDGTWELSRGPTENASITVEATPEAWSVFLTTPRESRHLPAVGISLEGSKGELKRFAKAFSADVLATAA